MITEEVVADMVEITMPDQVWNADVKDGQFGSKMSTK